MVWNSFLKKPLIKSLRKDLTRKKAMYKRAIFQMMVIYLRQLMLMAQPTKLIKKIKIITTIFWLVMMILAKNVIYNYMIYKIKLQIQLSQEITKMI